MILYLIFFFLIPSNTTFYSASGIVLWDPSNGLSCFGNLRGRQINFPAAFDNVPKLILTLEDFESTPNNLGVNFYVEIVTKTYFVPWLNCYWPTIYSFGFKWTAINSDSLTVIDVFNSTPTQLQTFTHSTPQASFAFVSVLAFGYTNEINFNLQVKEMNSTHITIENTNIVNLQKIGFQVIIGPLSMIEQLDSVTSSAPFTSPVYEMKPNSVLITPFSGFWHIPGTENITLRHQITATTQTGYYTSDSKGQSYYVKNNHLAILIRKQPLPIEYITLRITQIKDLQVDTRSTVQVTFPELNQVYQNVGQYVIDLTTSQLVVMIQIHTKCFKNKKYVSKFNKCNSCQNKKYNNFSHNCYGAINTLIYNAKFSQSMVTTQQLVLYLEDTSCKIIQVLQTQIIQQELVLQIQQFDI